MEIEITTTPLDADARTLSNGIIEFNRQAVPDLEEVEAEVRLFVFARDAHGRVSGGIRAVCFWNTLNIELLWLASACRGCGVGTRLLAAAEDFAIKRGYENAVVETTSWQARPFYEKRGYVVLASIAGRPKGYVSHYLHKSLATTRLAR